MADVNSLKDQGNKAFAAKDYDKAIDLFTQAVKLDPKNHVLYSNRSAAYAGKKEWTQALEDAESCIKANPTWSKGYSRKGAALHGAKRYDDAIAAYNDGIKLEDTPALRKGLKEVEDEKEKEAFAGLGGGGSAFGSLFSDPNILGKLATNPRTQKYLQDPNFVQRIQAIQKNPALADMFMQSDPRMIEVMGALMGIDMQATTRPEGSDDLPPGMSERVNPSSSSTPTSPPPQSKSSSSAPKSPEDAEMKPVEEDIVMDEATNEDKKAQAEAEEQKKIGSEAYKKRDFDAAKAAYEKAWELWPKDVTYLTNLAAVYIEQGKFDECIQISEKAVDEGRSLRADYKLIAKALGRIGSAYAKKQDFANAVKFFQKSLTEHRTADILNKLHAVEKEKAGAERQAYINPELAEKAREEGNTFFKDGKFADAVKSYTEAIKRLPTDPRAYNNRALCYTKLVALPEALKDAEEAIKVDPKFVKAYIRKANVLFAMKELQKAMDVAQEAADIDEPPVHATEIQQLVQKINQALYMQRSSETEEETLQRAMRDPEIAGIMQDPVMQQILQQGQSEPGALQEHMKNPVIRNKIMKLVSAGIIKTR